MAAYIPICYNYSNGQLTVLQPENTGSEIASKLDDIRWSNLLFALSVLIEFKGHYDQEVVKNAKVRLVKAWGEASNLEQRIASVKNLKQRLDHNAVNILKTID